MIPDANPYEPPRVAADLNHAPPKRRAYLIVGSMLLTPFLGHILGGGVGFAILTVLPTAAQPACGNEIVDPCMMVGTLAGIVVGIFFACWLNQKAS